jgi:AhpD family alkylhydroperoxidase
LTLPKPICAANPDKENRAGLLWACPKKEWPWMSGKAIVPLIEYEMADEAVRAVYDDIMQTRKVDWINNFWKVLAHDPALLKRTWETLRDVMAPGALDPLTKEMIYIAVSATNGCEYCTYSHTALARSKGLTEAQLMELLAVVGMANETNRLANGLRPPVDVQFEPRG